MPISSNIAESAVDQVVSLHYAKKRQLRWTDKGHTCLHPALGCVVDAINPIEALTFGSAQRCFTHNRLCVLVARTVRKAERAGSDKPSHTLSQNLIFKCVERVLLRKIQ
jgi:hypothetical protein